MQLKDLKLIEVSSTKVEFEQNSHIPGKGKTKIEYGQLNFEAGGTLTQNESKSTVTILASPQITGVREGSEVPEFTLKISMRMIYIYSK
ncbi:hypothetical protein, partial [Klebsiella pneumoniae]|uniref:hypothetical protein n=2 Tax=Klebsiella TaxID=570 RepID=UPI00115F4013